MSDVQIQVSNDVIKGIVEQKINSAVAAALAGELQLMEAIVQRAMSVKVNDEGKVSDYSSYNKHTLVEWLCKDAIRKAVDVSIREWVARNQALIQKNVEEHLKKNSKGIGQAFAQGMTDCLKTSWNMRVNVTLNEKQ